MTLELGEPEVEVINDKIEQEEPKYSEKRQFTEENVLTASMMEYVSSVGKTFKDYVMVGVHTEGDESSQKLMRSFLKKIPKDAEVVVGYNQWVAGTGSHFGGRVSGTASGTALIPLEKRLTND